MFSANGENDGTGARVGVRIGDSVLDLARALGDEVFGEPSLNAFMAQGRARWAEVRARITELLTAGQHRGPAEAALRPLSGVRLHKQNFRRLVEQQGLVEETGGISVATGGRPARRGDPAWTSTRPAIR